MEGTSSRRSRKWWVMEKSEKKKKCTARTLNDASLWPFDSLMVVRHASLCVPSVPFSLLFLSPIFLYSSIYPSASYPTRCTLRTPLQVPTIRRGASSAKGATLASKSGISSTPWGCSAYCLSTASCETTRKLSQDLKTLFVRYNLESFRFVRLATLKSD